MGSHFLYNASGTQISRAPAIDSRRPAHMLLLCSAQRLFMRLVVLATIVATLGCGQKLVFPRLEFKSDEAKTPSIPLTVRLEIPEALKHAQLFYKDSCGAPQAIPLGERLAEQVKADAAGVFEKTFEGSPKDPADAVLSTAMETGEINLYIPRREVGEYKMTVLVRLRVTVVDAEGKTLLNEPVKGEGKWTVTTDGTNCTIQGLLLPVTEALEKLSDRMVENLTQSVKIRDWAIRLGTRKEMMAAGRPGGSGGKGPPTRKRFVASIKSGAGAREPVEVLSVDVDQIPARVQGFERHTSYALVVGLGGYREESIPRLKHARRDAEVVTKHLTALAGFPPENVRVLTDEHALLVDLQDTFEDWLPQRANSSGIVFVYLVGNAILNAEGTDIILMPYEGRPDLVRRGYSLNRLQEVLARLPSRLNLVFADLSFPAGDGKGDVRSLPWSASKRRTVIIGSSSTNGPSLSWDAGQHGLFTYHFLKAIRGQGDADDNGWVDVGEIIAYLREQVPKGAAELKKQQVPAVNPEVEPDGPIGTFPFSKSRRRG